MSPGVDEVVDSAAVAVLYMQMKSREVVRRFQDRDATWAQPF
jgi:hypothetical protein